MEKNQQQTPKGPSGSTNNDSPNVPRASSSHETGSKKKGTSSGAPKKVHHPPESWKEIKRMQSVTDALQRRIAQLEKERDQVRKKARDQKPKPHAGLAGKVLMASAAGVLLTETVRLLRRARGAVDGVTRAVVNMRDQFRATVSRLGIKWSRWCGVALAFLFVRALQEAGVPHTQAIIVSGLSVLLGGAVFRGLTHGAQPEGLGTPLWVVGAIIASALGGGLIRGAQRMAQWGRLGKSFMDFQTCSEATGNWLAGVLDSLDKFLRAHTPVGLPLWFTSLYRARVEFSAQVDALRKEITNMQAALACDKRGFNAADQARVRVLLKQHARLRLDPHARDRDTSMLLERMLRELITIARELQVATSAQTSKPEPVFIMLQGPAGCGKSAMLTRLTDYLVEKCADPTVVEACKTCDNNYQHEVYTRAADDSYMSGYTNQLITVMDDFGQVKLKASTGNTSDFSFIITHVNAHMTHLNMAAIEDKGTKVFNSAFVIATTNPEWASEINDHLKCAAALERRIAALYHVLPHNNRFDYAELARSPAGSLPDLWEFHAVAPNVLRDVDTYPKQAGQKAGYKTLAMVAADAAALWHRRKALHDQYVDTEARESADVDQRMRAAVDAASSVAAEPEADGVAPIAHRVLALALRAEAPWTSPEYAFRIFEIDRSYTSAEALAHVGRVARRVRALVHPDGSNAYSVDEAMRVAQRMDDVDAILQTIHISWGRYTGKPHRAKEAYAWATQALKSFWSSADVVLEIAAFVAAVLIVSDFILRVYSALVGALSSLFGRKRVPDAPSQPSGEPTRAAPAEAHSPFAEGVPNYLTNNVWLLETEYVTADGKKASQAVGTVLFVRDELAIMPAHFLRYVVSPSVKRVGLTSRDGQSQLLHKEQFAAAIQDGVRMSARGSDLVLVQVPGVRRARDITAHFLDWDKDRFYKLSYPRAHTLRREGADIRVRDWGVPAVRPLERLDVSAVGVLHNVVAMPYAMGVGWCGALLLASSPSGPQVAGMYVAGDSDQKGGYFQTLSADALQRALRGEGGVPPLPDDDTTPRARPEAGSHPTYPDGIRVVGHVDPPVYTNPETRLRRSGMEEELGPGEHLPAMLRRTAGIDPIHKMLEPFGQPKPWVNSAEFTRPATEVLQTIKDCAGHRPGVRVLTTREAIEGVPELGIPPLPRDTSAGYPFCHWPYSKDQLLQQAIEGVSPPGPYDFVGELAAAEARILAGEPIGVLFMTFPKDELRTVDKVLEGKTRPIQGAPLHYVILWRRYCAMFEAAIKAGAPYNGFAVGVNPHSEDWAMAARMLADRSKEDPLDSLVFAGDYSRFDSSHQWALFWWYGHAMNEFYTPGYWYSGGMPEPASLARSALVRELRNVRFVCRGDVLEPAGGLPSGHPGTTYINSFINLMLLRAAFYKLCPDGNFEYSVRALVLGDDHVVAPSEGVSASYNQNTVVPVMADYGYTYTPETKAGAAPDLRRLGDVEMLKRRFAYGVTGDIVAPLRLDSILKGLRWRRVPLQGDAPFVQACEMALVELAKHDPPVWEEWAPRVATGCLRLTGATLMPTLGRQEFWLSRWSSLELPVWMQ